MRLECCKEGQNKKADDVNATYYTTFIPTEIGFIIRFPVCG